MAKFSLSIEGDSPYYLAQVMACADIFLLVEDETGRLVYPDVKYGEINRAVGELLAQILEFNTGDSPVLEDQTIEFAEQLELFAQRFREQVNKK